MRRAAFPLSILALGLLVFAAWMHPAVLWPRNVGWVLTGEDRGQAAIGLAAWLRAGTGLREPLLNAPVGTALLFTDSIPLLALLVAPFAPADTQFIGCWYLFSVLLQAMFAAALVRRWTPDALAAWCGAALLVLMPALLNRYPHASLTAQWLLLWALWVFAEPTRARAAGWWAAVLGVAALVHSYLLLGVLAIWSGALLEYMARRDGWGAARLVAVLAVPLAILAAHGAFAGPYVSTGTYGGYPAALDAWWNPANPDYSALLPSSLRAPDGRGFEGLNYLGAGLLALVLGAGGLLATGRVEAVRRATLKRLGWLVPPLAVLALLAWGPAPVWRGQPLFAVALPPGMVDLLDPVRASGRLLWPATYLLALAAIVIVGGTRRATLLLAAALALQVADLAPMLGAIRHASARADDPMPFAITRSAAWDRLVGQAAAIEFQPARPFVDTGVLDEVGWRAVAACRPLRWFYASRERVSQRAQAAADARAFAAGRLDPVRLYVLLGPDPASAAVAARVRILDGVRIIPPSRPGPPPACPSSPPAAP